MRPCPCSNYKCPSNVQGQFGGVVLGEYSIDSLLRYGTPTEVLARYAVTLLDAKGQVLAGTRWRRATALPNGCRGVPRPTPTKCLSRP